MLITHDIPSIYLGATRRITVWLPPGFKRRLRTYRYSVLYLNDGQNLFDPSRAFAGATWRVGETAADLVRRRRIPPMLIVGIDHGSERRAREYLPVDDERNPMANRPLGREYAEFVTREVMPFINRTYPVMRSTAATGFGGSSYGAVAALYTALVKPGLFGRLLVESPSLYVGRNHLLRLARKAGRWPSRIYLGVGTSETGREDWNSETLSNVLKLEKILRQSGLGERRLRVRVAPGASHSEAAWAARFPEALEFLFG
ncbi:MAG TPA: alpha/beta hydrolase-fold protein [Vicinamibacterales bacterium]|nr:alpha/beta hydrolase-fold protein [Vicinamibacterales bacterium]